MRKGRYRGNGPALYSIVERSARMTRMSKRRSVADAQGTATNRLNVKIPATAYDRLVLHALMSRRSPGEVVAELIESHLREYRVQRNSTARVMSNGSVSEEVQVEVLHADAA